MSLSRNLKLGLKDSNPAHRTIAVPEVVKLVGINSGLLSIPDYEIEMLRQVTTSGLYSEPWKLLRVGQADAVTAGPHIQLGRQISQGLASRKASSVFFVIC